MNANLTFATDGFLHRTRFVIVNDRVPRTDGHCALCGRIIEKGYVRDSQTRLVYCDTQCFQGGADWACPGALAADAQRPHIRDFHLTKEYRMAARQIKMPAKNHAEQEVEEVFSQSKRPERGRYSGG